MKGVQVLWFSSVQLNSVQSLSRVQLFATPWTVACQASLSITNSQSLLKLMPTETVMPSNHLILCQEYTEELYKKDHGSDHHDGVITHLEPDILECEVKWAQESSLQTKLVEVMEFQLSYFKS